MQFVCLADLVMVLIFCAFGAEFAPIRMRLRNAVNLDGGLRGARGELAGTPATIVVSGVGLRRARESAARAFDTIGGVDRAILTGVAGALHGDLRIGDVVLGDRLILRRELEFAGAQILEIAAERVETLAMALHAAGIAHMRGAMLTSRRAIATALDKQRAYTALGAIAVDMESAVIADEAAARGVPFVALRTILDTAAQNLEGAMLADEHGRVRALHAARALLGNPRLIGASFRLMRNLRLASASMAVAVEAAVAMPR
jgi:adenosylhomocysteine nucleosidase